MEDLRIHFVVELGIQKSRKNCVEFGARLFRQKTMVCVLFNRSNIDCLTVVILS